MNCIVNYQSPEQHPEKLSTHFDTLLAYVQLGCWPSSPRLPVHLPRVLNLELLNYQLSDECGFNTFPVVLPKQFA